MNLVDKMIALHRALETAGVPHAFGGALALAWCTERARGTIDVDLNLFVPPAGADAVLDALPDGVAVGADDRALIARDGQVRLWWDQTPVDVFFNTTGYHDDVATRVRVESLAGASLPFLACADLAVFKAFFNRTKDWADLEEMAAAGTLDATRVLGVLVTYLGADDDRVERVRAIIGQT